MEKYVVNSIGTLKKTSRNKTCSIYFLLGRASDRLRRGVTSRALRGDVAESTAADRSAFSARRRIPQRPKCQQKDSPLLKYAPFR